MYQANAEHTGFVPRSVLPQYASQRWAVQPHGSEFSGLAISDGMVFTTPSTYFGAEAPLVAQSLTTGQIAWSVDFGSVFSVNQPAIDNGLVYLQTSNNSGSTYLHCYSTTGNFQWRAPFASQWEHYLSPIIVGGKIYIDGGTYGGMYSFDAIGGKQIWYTGLPQYDSWSPTWTNGKLLAYTNQLDVLAPDTGQILGTITDPDYYWSGYSPNQAPVVVGDYAYVTNGGRLVAFNIQNNTIAWARSISATGQVATDGQQLFVIAGGALSVREPSTGNPLWAWVPSASGSITTNLIVTKSHVIAGDGNQTYLVNRTTHLVDHTFPVSGLLAYAADTLVVATQASLVYAFNLPTDELFANGFE